MTCRCGGAMYPTTIDYVSRWGKDGTYVRITDVPAWECERCHERVLDPAVVDEVQHMVREGPKGADRIDALPVKVYRTAAVPERPEEKARA